MASTLYSPTVLLTLWSYAFSSRVTVPPDEDEDDDELPEFINILKGDMSFIGPRPLLVKYLPLYNEEQRHRHDVRPGLTGWAQVNGRNLLSWEDRFEKDVYYARNISFLFDLKIFFMTIAVVFKHDDINSATDATMEAFTGTKPKEQ